MYALLAALSLLFPPSDLSNHWRWASASVNQSGSNPTPIPPTPSPSPTPTPNPVPIPSPTPVLKPGDDCPACTGGWIDSDGSAKVKCWKCNGDGIANSGDPILTGATEPNNGLQGILSQPEGNRINQDLKQTPSKTEKESKATNEGTISEEVPDSKAICYKPIYSEDGYYIWDLEGKKWVRSAKQPPVYKSIATGHWETRTYKSCNGRNCRTYTKQVWIADSPKRVLQAAPPRISHYPVRGSWWTGCRSYKHLLTGPHAGKFSEAYLKSLSWEELQSLHSDHHEQLRGRGSVKWSYVNK